MRVACCLAVGSLALIPSKAQAQTCCPPTTGQAVGLVAVVVGVGVAAGVGITYLALHNGVLEGCVAESSGTRTLVRSDKKVYTLLDGGPSVPEGDRVKLKGHKSGTRSHPSFHMEKVVKIYGPCQP